MKTAIYKLLDIKVKIIEIKGDLYTIKPLENGAYWSVAKVLKDKLRNIEND